LLVAIYRGTSPRPAVRSTIWCTWGYLVVVLLAGIGLWTLSDAWWPMTVLLFGPRWLVLMPLIVLVPATLAWQRRLLIPLLLALIVATTTVMGFRTGWRRIAGSDPSSFSFRVATFNAMGGAALNASLPWIIDGLQADVLGLQECSGRLVHSVRALPETVWHHHDRDGLCLVSRFPITGIEQMERGHFRQAGGAGVVIRYALDVDGRVVHLTNLHLETPRAALEQLRQGDVVEGQRRLESKSTLREIESRQARRWVDAVEGPALVVGDFNLPVESVIYGRYWGDLRNGFSRSGIGFGYTRISRWIRARIDHVLVRGDLTVRKAFVGPDFGSDHLPMVAELVLRDLPD
jgi:endonuclease/exonuclease/phosphatase (EEP) superfamily protein YafD